MSPFYVKRSYLRCLRYNLITRRKPKFSISSLTLAKHYVIFFLRDLRRERRSMLRRMSMFARDSILITPNVVQSPEQMRRFSRRLSRMSRRDGGGALSGSPALIRRLAELEKESAVPEGLRRRNRRGSSMAEADGGAGMKRWRSNSMWAFKTDSKVRREYHIFPMFQCGFDNK